MAKKFQKETFFQIRISPKSLSGQLECIFGNSAQKFSLNIREEFTQPQKKFKKVEFFVVNFLAAEGSSGDTDMKKAVMTYLPEIVASKSKNDSESLMFQKRLKVHL